MLNLEGMFRGMKRLAGVMSFEVLADHKKSTWHVNVFSEPAVSFVIA